MPRGGGLRGQEPFTGPDTQLACSGQVRADAPVPFLHVCVLQEGGEGWAGPGQAGDVTCLAQQC